ncbi:SDR family NAD(P)-dependent oxidoreductase [Celeribacter indicus]|uniref:Putative oxidoreductase protein n=1 Tax=Celeribacter indicus TaxID=1208324 RepID=A0A0B5E035_9RHOB|nr:SDR family oxidoreductase [Celeribacter indicus]AJE46745.1 putative oxidoreductase protein [Celeribacter indicus]SDX05420.1 3-oxoacyl-[acyl-carrier protein] reductase/meso-butanediol dehydrogenase / (S,S)-butanediol dehydrogenase / diacetyl reductase [Celeribacter indicus]
MTAALPQRYAGRTAILTGATGRLGAGIASRLAAEGARLCLVDRERPSVDDLAASLAADFPGARPAVFVGDLADPGAADKVVHEIFGTVGTVELLVNAAGGYLTGGFLSTGAHLPEAIGINLMTAANMIRGVARHWVAHGAQGTVVNLTSAASLHPAPATAGYVASKAGLNALTSTLAMELGQHGIRVNAIAPGMILGEVFTAAGTSDPEILRVLDGTPLGRTGRPEDVAAAVAFLGSDDAAWITGAILPVTGGAHSGRPHFPVAD